MGGLRLGRARRVRAVTGELRRAMRDALDGPDVASVYECAHCGDGVGAWSEDCPRCGGVVMRIVTDLRDA